MSRYLLFAGADYYPSGGWYDFVGEFDGVDDAKAAFVPGCLEWAQVVDADTKQIVWRFGIGYTESGHYDTGPGSTSRWVSAAEDDANR